MAEPTKNRIPKKFLKTKQIAITSNYGATISIWIPDTPYSVQKPKVVVTLSHKNNKCSFVFDNEYDMCDMFNDMAIYLEDNRDTVGESLRSALDDMHDYRLWRNSRKSKKNLKLVDGLNTLNTR